MADAPAEPEPFREPTSEELAEYHRLFKALRATADEEEKEKLRRQITAHMIESGMVDNAGPPVD